MVDGSLEIRVYDFIVAMENRQYAKSDFRVADLGSFFCKYVRYLPSQFNGNAIFGLPPLLAPKIDGKGRLEGMDRRYDVTAGSRSQPQIFLTMVLVCNSSM